MDRIRKTGIGVVVCAVFIAAAVGLHDVSTSGITKPPATPPPPPTVKIGFIGDSITVGPGGDVKNAADTEIALLGSNYKAVNRGVNGSTTNDWQPGEATYDDTLAEFKRQQVRIVSLMLGTNDASVHHRTPPDTYKKNMENIVNNLLQSGTVTRVVVNYPPYVTPDAPGHKGDQSQKLLEAYTAKIDELGSIQGVLIGDRAAYGYFKQHPDNLADGVHPTKEGYARLGELWAQAYMRILATMAQ